jgi:carotenoid cleavage dioxygenase-like enzyme
VEKAPYLTYGCLDAAGKLERSVDISTPFPSMVHDFAITKDFAVFLDAPFIFDIKVQCCPYQFAVFLHLPRHQGAVLLPTRKQPIAVSAAWMKSELLRASDADADTQVTMGSVRP